MDIRIERNVSRAIVSLKISQAQASAAEEYMRLAEPLRCAGTDPQSLWLAPDHWLLLSKVQSARRLVQLCSESLHGILHNAVDYTAAMAGITVEGRNSRELISMGTCLDLRPSKFPAGACASTRLAQIAAVIVAREKGRYGLYVDRSYETYLIDWLSDSAAIAARAASTPSTEQAECTAAAADATLPERIEPGGRTAAG